MRIISDFHDYYDSVQAAGQDQTLIYFRKPEEVDVVEYAFPTFSFYTWSNEPHLLQLQQHVVGFCGKIYPVMVLTHATTNKTAICYELDDVNGFVNLNFRKRAVEEYRTKSKRRYWGRYLPGGFCRELLAKYFTECAAKKDSFAEMFLEKRCPVFIGTIDQHGWRKWSQKIVYNASLKQLEFFRLFDTYSAFQEIAMFLGGLAVPLKEIPQVPDRIMVGVKGFDQWSFRKPPEKG